MTPISIAPPCPELCALPRLGLDARLRAIARERRAGYIVLQEILWLDALHDIRRYAADRREGRRRRGLGAIEDELGLHRALLLTVEPISDRIQVPAQEVRHDHEVAVGLESRGEHPENVDLREDIVILVYNRV